MRSWRSAARKVSVRQRPCLHAGPHDETWAKTNMTRTHGRARRGEPASCSKNGVDPPRSRPEPLRE